MPVTVTSLGRASNHDLDCYYGALAGTLACEHGWKSKSYLPFWILYFYLPRYLGGQRVTVMSTILNSKFNGISF